jgi:hypothetical protein
VTITTGPQENIMTGARRVSCSNGDQSLYIEVDAENHVVAGSVEWENQDWGAAGARRPLGKNSRGETPAVTYRPPTAPGQPGQVEVRGGEIHVKGVGWYPTYDWFSCA